MGLNGMRRAWRGVAKWVGRGFIKRVTAMVQRTLVDPVGEAYTATILSKWWDCTKPTI
jgi:hypothetical protein